MNSFLDRNAVIIRIHVSILFIYNTNSLIPFFFVFCVFCDRMMWKAWIVTMITLIM